MAGRHGLLKRFEAIRSRLCFWGYPDSGWQSSSLVAFEEAPGMGLTGCCPAYHITTRRAATESAEAAAVLWVAQAQGWREKEALHVQG